MAEGDITVFDEAKLAILNKEHDFDTDTFKLAILDATSTMAANTSAPALGHANFVEVGVSGTYVAGGNVMANPSLTNTAGTIKFDADDPATWLSNGLNDADARWGLIYNDTHASNAAIAYLDLGANIDMSTVDLTVNWNASGIFTLT